MPYIIMQECFVYLIEVHISIQEYLVETRYLTNFSKKQEYFTNNSKDFNTIVV
jgi:hypothetical protein